MLVHLEVQFTTARDYLLELFLSYTIYVTHSQVFFLHHMTTVGWEFLVGSADIAPPPKYYMISGCPMVPFNQWTELKDLSPSDWLESIIIQYIYLYRVFLSGR